MTAILSPEEVSAQFLDRVDKRLERLRMLVRLNSPSEPRISQRIEDLMLLRQEFSMLTNGGTERAWETIAFFKEKRVGPMQEIGLVRHHGRTTWPRM